MGEVQQQQKKKLLVWVAQARDKVGGGWDQAVAGP